MEQDAIPVFNKLSGLSVGSVDEWGLFNAGAAMTVLQDTNGRQDMAHCMTLQWRPGMGGTLMDPLKVGVVC